MRAWIYSIYIDQTIKVQNYLYPEVRSFKNPSFWNIKSKEMGSGINSICRVVKKIDLDLGDKIVSWVT